MSEAFIRRRYAYDLVVDGKTVADLTIDSKWEDFVKFKTRDGGTVIGTSGTSHIDNALAGLFQGEGDDERRFDLLKASPGLIAELKLKAKAPLNEFFGKKVSPAGEAS